MIGLPDLQWFPKPFGPGDTDGTGQQRSLGQPSYAHHEILIREMAQNSWDARLGDRVPEFELRLRTLGTMELDILKWNVFRSSSQNLGLAEALDAAELSVVEIADRGTKGLGGPIRNDLHIPQGAIKDYADFVLTLGAPPDALGGGTYGYGKTAAYRASSCSTIVIWSRWRDEATGALEERFVASAMGPSFVSKGRQFTGRQWWGWVEPDGHGSDMVVPATDDDAKRLGERLFERAFIGEETGTSLLILAPREDLLTSEEPGQSTADLWRQAVLQHLWPKLAPGQDSARRMSIRMYDHGSEVPIIDPEAPSDILDAGQQCLSAIRDVQSGGANENPLVEVHELWRHRPKLLLGHLALTRIGPIDEDDPLTATADSVTYMRSAPELVVTTESFGDEPHALSHWIGVFKPTEELDPLFAQAEPPAHDSWNAKSLDDRETRLVVQMALTRIKEVTTDFLRPAETDVVSEGAVSTGALSAALAGLAGAADGALPVGAKKPKSGGSSKRSAKPKVMVSGEPIRSLSDSNRERQLIRLPLRIDAVSAVMLSASRMAIAVDGASVENGEDVRLEGWIRDGEAVSDEEVRVQPGPIDVVFSHPLGIAIDVDFMAVIAP